MKNALDLEYCHMPIEFISVLGVGQKARITMTNKEKYMNEILARRLYLEWTDDEMKGLGIKGDSDGDITTKEIEEWLEQEYKPSEEERFEEVMNVSRSQPHSDFLFENPKEETDKPTRELKVGDRVRVRGDRGKRWANSGNMDEYCDTEQTIRRITDDGQYELNNCTAYKYESGYWVFDEEDLTPIEDEETKPKNYIAKFMKDNGLEIGEEFGIDGKNERYHFGSDYILCSSLEFECPNKLQCLLAGELKPIKLEPQVDRDSMAGKYARLIDNKDGVEQCNEK